MTRRERSSFLGAALALLALTVVPRAARAADPPLAQASLTFERQKGAEACPDETALKREVAVRLGYDPFQEGAKHHVSVSISPKPDREGVLHARIKTFDLSAEGAGPALHELDGESPGCDEVFASIVLAVSLAIDPMSFSRARAPAPAPTPAPAPPPPPTPAPAPTPAPPPGPPWLVDVTASARLGFGLVPSLSLGPVVDVEVGKRSWSLLAEAGADFPLGATTLTSTSGVEASLLRGGIGACGKVSVLVGCGRFDLGGMKGSSTGSATSHIGTSLYLDAAVFAGLRIPLVAGLHLDAGAELVVPLTPTTLYADRSKNVRWDTPSVAGATRLGLGYRF